VKSAPSSSLASTFALALGAAGTMPPSRSALAGEGWHGRIAFQALRGGLPGGSELQPVSGVIRRRPVADLRCHQGQTAAMSLPAWMQARCERIVLNAASALRCRRHGAALSQPRVPAGRASMQDDADEPGRSASALAGALSAAGLTWKRRISASIRAPSKWRSVPTTAGRQRTTSD
jgi:large subunit ribosomal protein L24